MSKADISTTPIRSRRAVLAGGASAAALALIPATPAIPALDPVFELIETHRKAHIAHVAAIELQARFQRRYGMREGSHISTEPCHKEHDAFEALVAAPATTMQGLLVQLDYYQELSNEFETEWMIYDRAEAAVLIQSFAASLKNIAVRS